MPSPIRLTPAARKELLRLLDSRPESGVRIRLRTRGCSGLSYILEYVAIPNEEEEKISIVDSIEPHIRENSSLEDIKTVHTTSEEQDKAAVEGVIIEKKGNSEDFTGTDEEGISVERNRAADGRVEALMGDPIHTQDESSAKPSQPSFGEVGFMHRTDSVYQSHANSISDPYRKIDPSKEVHKSYFLYVHSKALLFLVGTEMDFQETPTRKGFVFQNPQEKGKCGCGASFHV